MKIPEHNTNPVNQNNGVDPQNIGPNDGNGNTNTHSTTSLFFKKIDDFVNLLNDYNNRFLLFGRNIVHSAAEYISAAVRFFSEIFTPPLIDLHDPEVKAQIEKFAVEINDINAEILSIPEKFKYNMPHGEYILNLTRIQKLHEKIYFADMQLTLMNAELHGYKTQPAFGPKIKELYDQYNQAAIDLNNGIYDHKDIILNIFNRMYDEFCEKRDMASMPKDLKDELFALGCLVLDVTVPLGEEEFFKRFDKLRHVEDSPVLNEVNIEKGAGIMPLPLINIGNSCYMDSAIQAIFSIEEMRKKLYEPLVLERMEEPDPQDSPETSRKKEERNLKRREEHALKLNLQRSLINVIEKRNTATPQFPFLSYLFGFQPLKTVRRDLFTFPALKEENIIAQQDAGPVTEILMREILNQKFFIQRRSSAEEIPGRIFYGNSDPVYGLQIDPIHGVNNLQSLVDLYFKEESQKNDGKKWKPKDGIIFNDEAAKTLSIPEDEDVTPDFYDTSLRLKTLPDVMTIQCKRFDIARRVAGAEAQKNYDPIKISERGIDFTNFHCPDNESDKQSAKYEVVGIIIHIGTAKGGHYVSKVKIGEKFYLCDDNNRQNLYLEIAKEQFYSEENGYIFVLKRIKENANEVS